MKVQCDVCEKAQATLLCCADEASLCAVCDKRIHAANKLAGKHQRVPLFYPAPEELPCCDVCQDKIGYFFCLEDRALLCRNCDYSIHSANALAAKHKRFLVSGIRVALQVMSSIDATDNPPACSPSQVSSPATQVSNHLSPQSSQLSSPTQNIPLGTPRMPLVQKPSRMTLASPVPSVPQEASRKYGKAVRDESLSSLPSLSSTSPQNQMEVTHSVAEQGTNTVVVDPFSPKVVSTSGSATLPPQSLNQQFFLDGGRQQATWETRYNMDMSAQDISREQMLTNQRSVGGNISEYLTEAIPGWRVDELFNLPDMDGPYKSNSAKTFALNVGDIDWPTESSGSEDLGLGASLAEVPSIPSPPTASGVTGSTKRLGLGKPLKEADLDFFLHCDDTLVVPDIGGVESPTVSPSSHSQKRRRSFMWL